MAASALGAHSRGFDVNPLACLITAAKATEIEPSEVNALAQRARSVAGGMPACEPLKLRHSKVEWFSEHVAVELAQIISWLSSMSLDRKVTQVVAVALSGATRDASWIRKSGWKLHRMDEAARAAHRVSAWKSFARRLDHYARYSGKVALSGTVEITEGSFDTYRGGDDRFDVILTSPPYGDSRTTVQYGAASGICLDVISRLPGLEQTYRPGGRIDADCLGTRGLPPVSRLKPFWSGAASGEAARRVSSFLGDFRNLCTHLRAALAPDGTIVMVVGRRSVGGFRVRLDEFAIATMKEAGLRCVAIERRALAEKTLPRVVNRFARSMDVERRVVGQVKTMDSEIILTFRD
jgi:hypothetical protein